MPTTAESLFLESLSLPVAARADLTDRLVHSLAHSVPPVIEQAHLAEVRRRMAEVASGKVALIEGDKALAKVRAQLTRMR